MTDENIGEPMYTRSNGAKIPCADMAFPHLQSAYAKRMREEPDHPENPGMAATIARREAEFEAAKLAEEQTQ